jgi:pimeloyl-ACP methyl ester carboxylesterase
MKTILIVMVLMISVSCSFNEETTMEKEISEKIFVEINGSMQGMFINGKKMDNPVLLFIHGGPGMPEYPLTEKYPVNIDEHFVVCWWEQRGAGLSYSSELNYDEITIDQLVLDTIEVTNYLRKRFNKDKIFLIGHSFGSFIGLKTVKKAPELFEAYVGMAQISNQLTSEKIAYEYMLEQYKMSKNEKMVEKLKEYDILSMKSLPLEYIKFRDRPMHELGIGTMHEMKSVITGIFFPVMGFSGYTIMEKINLWRAKSKLLNKTNLWNTIISTDLRETVKEIDVPIYFFHGIHDLTVNYSLAKEYYRNIKAPLKGFYTFEKSAHSPIFEEPDKFIKIMTEEVMLKKTGSVQKD